MTASEFAFLALGLVLGVASGAALIEVLRSRPPAPREVRVTVAPDSVPRRRSSTLAEDAFAAAPAAPARGGPADRRLADRPGHAPAGTAAATPTAGTAVRSAPLPPAGAGDPASSFAFGRGMTLAGTALAGATAGSVPGVTSAFVAPRYGTLPVAVRVHDETDWTLAAMRAAAPGGEPAATEPGAAQPATATATATAVMESPAGDSLRVESELGGGARPDADGAATGAADPNDPCAEGRRTADERCTLAARASDQAKAAHDALRAAQRAYDDHHGRAEQAASAADPRHVREAKETAQQAFRTARAVAASREDIETAARDWLTEINRINHDARDAAAIGQRERAAANALVATIERLSVEADAARISSEAAEAACVAARQAVADCQEAQQTAAAARTAFPSAPSIGFGAGLHPGDDDASELEAAFEERGAGEPAILRLVRGDRATMGRLVAALGGDDESERRRWQRGLGDLIDAIVGRAIEASALTFPIEHPFWGAFSLAQNRDIVAALSSLGFRFDGLGGWVDDRIPGQRDLSLAVGFAGLDPMRLRRWPNEREMAALFDGVAVAADEYLAETAGDLTLGELVDVLGRRADGLAELWNDWGRVRPLLLKAE